MEGFAPPKPLARTCAVARVRAPKKNRVDTSTDAGDRVRPGIEGTAATDHPGNGTCAYAWWPIGLARKGENVTRVLFLCTHNSARSQMAEGLLRVLGGGRFEVASAGTEQTRVRPEAIAVMQEAGIDISAQTSKTLERFLGEPWDEVITVCDSANESCPVFPGARRRRHWSIADPSGIAGDDEARLAAFRRARDELRRRIETELLADGAPAPG